MPDKTITLTPFDPGSASLLTPMYYVTEPDAVERLSSAANSRSYDTATDGASSQEFECRKRVRRSS